MVSVYLHTVLLGEITVPTSTIHQTARVHVDFHNRLKCSR
jgi:hypothetical protein